MIVRLPSLAAVLTALGCGAGMPPTPPTATVIGTVPVGGKPLPGGNIMFHGKDGVGTGHVKPDGTYTATAVPQGECKVTVDNTGLRGASVPPPGAAAMPGMDSEKGRKYVPLHPRYAKPETSGLATTVAGTSHAYDADLK